MSTRRKYDRRGARVDDDRLLAEIRHFRKILKEAMGKRGTLTAKLLRSLRGGSKLRRNGAAFMKARLRQSELRKELAVQRLEVAGCQELIDYVEKAKRLIVPAISSEPPFVTHWRPNKRGRARRLLPGESEFIFQARRATSRRFRGR